MGMNKLLHSRVAERSPKMDYWVSSVQYFRLKRVADKPENLEVMDMYRFQVPLLGSSSYGQELESAKNSYRTMLASVLGSILDRYERNPDSRFIDTKLNLVTGQDFGTDDPIRGRNTIYPWIQGRGLEALAGHIDWLRNDPALDREEAGRLIERSQSALKEVFSQMEHLRRLNGGRLYFMMTPQGQALCVDGQGHVVPYELKPDSPSSFSDLFYVKGMAAAARMLGLEKELDESMQWIKRICRDIVDGNFSSDQQQFDPKNIAAKKVEGRHPQGFFMIALGAIALFIRCGGDEEFKQIGFEFLDHILKFHVNLDQDSDLSKKYDMWEFVDGNGLPFVGENNVLLSDPGHACEFVGLALGMVSAMERRYSLDASDKGKIAHYKQVLPEILKQNFANGFPPKAFGLPKAFDLISRKVVNPDMPWWSLPETMRAAAWARQIVPPEERLPFETMVAECSNAFVGNYVRPDLNLMAVQTIDKDGAPVDVIPATPDADPGYHTGLSIIDFLAS